MGEENPSWNQWKWSRLPDKVLKCISRFQWISPKSMCLCCWFQRCWVASSRHSVRLLNLIIHLFATSGRVRECPFCLRGTAEMRSNFSFSLVWFLFPHMRRPYFLSGASGNFCTFWIFFFYLFSFSVFNHYGLTSIWIVFIGHNMVVGFFFHLTGERSQHRCHTCKKGWEKESRFSHDKRSLDEKICT